MRAARLGELTIGVYFTLHCLSTFASRPRGPHELELWEHLEEAREVEASALLLLYPELFPLFFC